jgi:hypothetical protein
LSIRVRYWCLSFFTRFRGPDIRFPRIIFFSKIRILSTSAMPVTTLRQARNAEQAHSLSHTNLNNLPAEIIQEIANHLHPPRKLNQVKETETKDPLEFSDDDEDQMSVFSRGPGDGTPEVKVMPCCRPGDDTVVAEEPRIDVLDGSSIFSAASSRLRNIVFNGRQTRRRTIRYCDKWIQETRKLSEMTRSRYT